MTSTLQLLPTASFNALTLGNANASMQSFSPSQTFSTADMLLRVAARRRFVRAVQAMRRR